MLCCPNPHLIVLAPSKFCNFGLMPHCRKCEKRQSCCIEAHKAHGQTGMEGLPVKDRQQDLLDPPKTPCRIVPVGRNLCKSLVEDADDHNVTAGADESCEPGKIASVTAQEGISIGHAMVVCMALVQMPLSCQVSVVRGMHDSVVNIERFGGGN